MLTFRQITSKYVINRNLSKMCFELHNYKSWIFFFFYNAALGYLKLYQHSSDFNLIFVRLRLKFAKSIFDGLLAGASVFVKH